EGTQQSGVAFDLKIADITRDGQLLELARNVASKILDADPQLASPENAIFVRQLRRLKKEDADWSRIS
ncbi:MAG: ATP-dependent DNA helicase RecG, partial [Bacteroidaceae bacterium]|nr:ATP-dependent DNA helicase RecG [Bacteroidaceae bacterium]